MTNITGYRGLTSIDLDDEQARIDRIVSDSLRKAFAEFEIDTRPITLDLHAAMAYTGLSRTALNDLARNETVIVRKVGVKNLFDRASLDRYIRSLPARGAHAA
ncbi:hypothetical protein ACFPPE_07475 [Agromyces tardus]|uniref:hypothetical protein n=1 Tax=Agromyces tardus TaxID=2583849 RepID=UPI00361C009A